MVEKPIAMNKIADIKITKFDWKELNPRKKSDFNDLPLNYKDIVLYQLHVSHRVHT
jgi:hypothetical protein